jgi:tetratricopeptide (TPR) repeat protein
MSASISPAAEPQAMAMQLQQAITWHQQGQLVQAEDGYRAVLQIEPGNFHALHLLGVLAHQCGQQEAAVELIQAALRVDPRQAEVYSNLGVVLQTLKRSVEALNSFSEALRLRPDYVEALNNRGNVLRSLKRPREALLDYELAIQIKPDYAEAFNHRGNALRDLDCLDAALDSFEHATQLAPDYAEAWNNRGTALKDLQRYDEALQSFAQAIRLRPAYADAHWKEGLCRLLHGDFALGWRKHEWRWQAESLALIPRFFAQPLWLGQGVCDVPGVIASHALLDGKTILLHAEQGWGDTLQFCRYAQHVAALGATVLLEVQPPLKTLLAGLAGVAQVFARGETLPLFDFHCPLLSLPLALGSDSTNMLMERAYLQADPVKVARWSAHLSGHARTLVGLAWSGNPWHGNDRRRSIPLAQLAPLFAANVDFISIQTEVCESDREAFTRLGLVDVAAELHDFSDTAALLVCLDQVIAVDTTGAHLAGALGRPTTVLLPYVPDFRWLLGREDTPWYPTMRLLRATAPGVWGDVVERAAETLLTGRHA